MTEWRDFIQVILKDKLVEDVAVVGLYDNRAVWVAKPGGILAAISPTEVEALVGKDRGTLCRMGITLGGRKMVVIRDHMIGPESRPCFVDLRTKNGDGKAVTVARSTKALVIVIGKRGAHGGLVNKRVCDLAMDLKRRYL
ncbi:profilin-3-like [Chanos chanos]|uniref:Profilin n=1 Tax=Chanos chanos TaxID=29144 RepID=A0A6J2UMP4_CHACN|nr:profilin-3-like [Chanos chanos]